MKNSGTFPVHFNDLEGYCDFSYTPEGPVCLNPPDQAHPGCEEEWEFTRLLLGDVALDCTDLSEYLLDDLEIQFEAWRSS